MDTKSIGLKIKLLRELRGFSQEELASRVDLSYQQIQKYEYGESKITIERLSAVARALDCTIFELLTLDYYRLKDSVGEYKPGKDLFKLTKEEEEVVKAFRRIKREKLKQSALSLLKGLADTEQSLQEDEE